MIICSNCGETQWSVMDRNYLELYNQCWSCDKKLWEEGKLSLKEFEEREKKSLAH